MSQRDRDAGTRQSRGLSRVDLHETVQAMRRRDWMTEGIPTFLLLEDQAATLGDSRIDTEGRTLGRMAEKLASHLKDAARIDDRPSLQDTTSLALEVLAALHFSPPHPADEVPRDSPNVSSLAAAFAAGRYVRAVSFHATPRWTAGRLEAQLSRFAERFAPVSYPDLLGLAERGEWPHRKPGVILNFFDGHRDNLEVAVPALDRVGLIGWFFVVPAWVTTPPREQRDFALRHGVDLTREQLDHADTTRRIALLPDEVAALAERGHVVASHTLTHAAVNDPGNSPETLRRETLGSMSELQRFLGGRKPGPAIAWRNGSRLGTNGAADDALRRAGYELVFANGAVQRVRPAPSRSV